LPACADTGAMDLALTYNPALQAFDIALDGTDLAFERTLASAILTSLFCDRQVEPYEVDAGEDRRGWWADAYAAVPFKTGSRLWLLERCKRLPSNVKRCEQYCQEALDWLVRDGLAQAVTVTAFAAKEGWLAAIIKVDLPQGSRKYRFEFDESRQIWTLAGEVQ
jgi:phage gp46-like protein